MNALYRRQRQQYFFAALLGFIAVTNALFFLILYRPARADYDRLQDSVQKLRGEVVARRLSIERLEKISSQLETSAQDRQQLYTRHFIPLGMGWSEIIRQLDEMVRTAGVRNTRKGFAMEQAPQYGLRSVRIGIPVMGPYSNIVNLIRDIENSDTFFIISSIDFRGNAQAGVPDITLSLNLETFFYQ